MVTKDVRLVMCVMSQDHTDLPTLFTMCTFLAVLGTLLLCFVRPMALPGAIIERARDLSKKGTWGSDVAAPGNILFALTDTVTGETAEPTPNETSSKFSLLQQRHRAQLAHALEMDGPLHDGLVCSGAAHICSGQLR